MNVFRNDKAMRVLLGGLVIWLGAGSALAVSLKIQPEAKDGLIAGDAPAKVTVTVTDKDGESGAYELHQQVVNRYGEVSQGEILPVQLEGEWSTQVDVPAEYYGPVTYRVSLVPAGQTVPVAQAERMMIRPVPVPILTMQERASSSMGINVHHNAHWDTLAACGVHWARDYCWGWLGKAETLPVAANKTDFRNLFQHADKAGITILPVMQKAFRTPDNKFFLTDSDVISKAYQRLSEYWPMIPYWELDNEADLEHRDKQSEEHKQWMETYIGYILAADRGLTEANRGAKVVLNGEAGIHFDRTQELIEKAGDHFSVVNYHYYSGTVGPELAQRDTNTGGEDRPQTITFLDQLKIINRMAHDAGKEAWLTEMAWSARSGPAVGDRLQSAYLQRLYLLARWAETDKTFWFWDRNMRGAGRFSSTGFIDDKDGLLPAGAAMAAVSKFTAQARYGGSVDIGPDRWCLLFERPEGGWLVSAWAVEGEYELPGPLAQAEQAFEMYGNPLRDRRLTAEPAYFMLAELPKAWLDQRHAEWLTPSIINVYQGGEAKVEIKIEGEAAVRWENLPAAAQCGEWTPSKSDQIRQATLKVSPQLEAGTYSLSAVIVGDGWEKRFPLTMKVLPAVDVYAEPYVRGQDSRIDLTLLIDQPMTAKCSVQQGQVSSESVSLVEGKTASIQFSAPQSAVGPIAWTLELENGSKLSGWLRPKQLNVAQAGELVIDGDLSDWSDAGRLVPADLKVTGAETDFAPKMYLAWSEKGLYVAAEIPVGEGFTTPSRPGDFWEWTSVEMSLNAADLKTEAGVTRSHLFWFTPYRNNDDSPWRIYAGEWLKEMEDGQKKTIEDDARFVTAMRYQDGVITVEGLIPVEVLGATPRADAVWPLAVNAKKSAALSPKTVAVWPGGEGKGWDGWGRVIFVARPE